MLLATGYRGVKFSPTLDIKLAVLYNRLVFDN